MNIIIILSQTPPVSQDNADIITTHAHMLFILLMKYLRILIFHPRLRSFSSDLEEGDVTKKMEDPHVSIIALYPISYSLYCPALIER